MPVVRGVARHWTDRIAKIGERVQIRGGFYQVSLDQSLQRVFVAFGLVSGEKLWIPHGTILRVLDVPMNGTDAIVVGDYLVAVYTEGKEKFGNVPPIGWGRSTHFVRSGQLVEFSKLDGVTLRVGERVSFFQRVWLFVKPW